MIVESLCVIAFLVTFILRKRGPVAGIVSVLVVGYVYGILRANFRVTASYFFFDSAILGLFAAELSTRVSRVQLHRERHLREWVISLVVVPALLLLLPLQDPLVQLVGFRSVVMFLPFFLLGSRLDISQLLRLAACLAVINIAVLGVAVFEFFNGIDMLYPRSAVTEIIYRSNDVVGGTYRIPATFSNSASYGTTMVLTIPLLSLGIAARQSGWRLKAICFLGIAAALVGVFMSAFRSAAIVAALTMVAVLMENRRSARVTAGMVIGIFCIALIVRAQPRLQRFTTLSNANYVSNRVAGSANLGIVEIITHYPFGNGLGAGGTSLPYFLQNRVKEPVYVENEYARVLLEQGILGLSLWIAFLVWLFTRRMRRGHWGNATVSMRAACMGVFATGMLGTGLLAAIPFTVLLFLMMGSLVRQSAVIAASVRTPYGDNARAVLDSSSEVVLAG